MNKNTKYWIFSGVGIIILISVFVGYNAGYRFQNNFMIGTVGTLYMKIPHANTNVFVDSNKKITTTSDNEVVKVSLSPRDHSVIVSRDGYFPWKKDFTVPSGKALTLVPIFIPQNASGEIITKKDPEYLKLKNAIQKNTPAVKASPLASNDASTALWLEDNAIIIKTETATSTVIQPDDIVKNLFFYKDRTDAVIFSMSEGIYMIETNREGTQNFFPIYKGKDPYFIETDPNFIYVLDGENLMQVVI